MGRAAACSLQPSSCSSLAPGGPFRPPCQQQPPACRVQHQKPCIASRTSVCLAAGSAFARSRPRLPSTDRGPACKGGKQAGGQSRTSLKGLGEESTVPPCTVKKGSQPAAAGTRGGELLHMGRCCTGCQHSRSGRRCMPVERVSSRAQGAARGRRCTRAPGPAAGGTGRQPLPARLRWRGAAARRTVPPAVPRCQCPGPPPLRGRGSAPAVSRSGSGGACERRQGEGPGLLGACWCRLSRLPASPHIAVMFTPVRPHS